MFTPSQSSGRLHRPMRWPEASEQKCVYFKCPKTTDQPELAPTWRRGAKTVRNRTVAGRPRSAQEADGDRHQDRGQEGVEPHRDAREGSGDLADLEGAGGAD